MADLQRQLERSCSKPVVDRSQFYWTCEYSFTSTTHCLVEWYAKDRRLHYAILTSSL